MAGKYDEYFKTDDEGNVYIRTDFKDKLKEFKGNKLHQFISLLFSPLSKYSRHEITEHLKLRDSYNERKDVNRTRRYFEFHRKELTASVINRDGERCRFCGTNKDLTIDHIKPLSKGGTNEMSNLQLLCRKHNSKKGAR